MILEFNPEPLSTFVSGYRRLIIGLNNAKNTQAAAFLTNKLMDKLKAEQLFVSFANTSPVFEKYHSGENLDIVIFIQDKLIATAFLLDFVRFAKDFNCYQNLIVQTPLAAEIMPYITEDGYCVICEGDHIAVALE